VLTDDESRRLRTRGKSTPDLLRARAGDLADAPDAVVRPGGADEVQAVLDVAVRHHLAVVRPGSHEEVAALITWAVERHVALVPFGGGTSVVGGLVARREGYAGVVSLDLGRMKRLLAVDPVSMTATLEPGLRGPEAEALLAEHGMTLGHFPQSFEYATIGGFAATRSSGQSSAGYGRFDSVVTGLEVATPAGRVALGHAPASAAGPDLRQLFLGSEGALGVITAVTVRVRPLPEERVYEGWRWPSFDAGSDAMRRLAQSQLLPTVVRLSDEAETAINLADPESVGGASAGGCLMIVGYEGTPAAVTARRTAVSAVLADLGAEPAGEQPGRTWAAGRYDAPYLRDSMLDVGVLVETLETAAYWSGLREVYDAVSAALRGSLGESAIVLCHVSHVYETGASLYFTVAAAEGDDPLDRWSAAKTAAMNAIVGVGATITHHHGVGTDHQPWLAAEIGPVGVAVLRAVKDAVDPDGILNPGVLVP
jgi:alkyldihydroxyacetonephosphate synthase